MKTIKKFLKKVNESLTYQTVVCIVVMGLIFGIYSLLLQKIEHEITIYENDYTWVYQVDSAKQQGKKLVLQGWAFELSKDAQENAYEIVFQDVNTQKRHFFDMEYNTRKDVNDYFLCEYDYSKSGFTATIPLQKLDMTDGIYEVLLRPKDVRKAFPTGMYFADGEIQYADPREFVAPEVSGTDLEDVVNDGIIKAYSKEHQCYLYQKDGYLYFVANRESSLFQRATDYVDVAVETTQVSRLPVSRQEANLVNDNKDFYFESCEIKEEELGKYRVAKIQIPTEYAVTVMSIGYRDNGWIWKSKFYIHYGFDGECEK